MSIWKKLAGLCALCLITGMQTERISASENGFDTPEEAVTAYVEGLREQDLEKMFSAFAVENYRYTQNLEQGNSSYPGYGFLTGDDDYGKELNIEWRKYLIYQEIRDEYLVMTESALLDGETTYRIKDYNNDAAELLDHLFKEDDSVFLNQIELKGFYRLEESELYMDESVQKRLGWSAERCDGEEVRSVMALLTIAQKDYLMMPDMVRYGDRWYLLTLEGELGSKAQCYYGLLPVDELLIYSDLAVALSCSFSEISEGEPDEVPYKMERDFDTPEDVLAAYVEGFQEQDIDKMVSAFAVETFVDQYRLEEVVERYGTYVSPYCQIPNVSTYARKLNLEERKRELIITFRIQYLSITEAPILDNLPWINIQDYDKDVQGFLEESFVASDQDVLDHIVLQGYFDVEKLIAFPDTTEMQRIQENGMSVYGGEIRPVAAWLIINNKDYLLLMDTIQYEGRWYGLDLGGSCSNYLETRRGIGTSGGLYAMEAVKELESDIGTLNFEDSFYTVS